MKRLLNDIRGLLEIGLSDFASALETILDITVAVFLTITDNVVKVISNEYLRMIIVWTTVLILVLTA